MTGVGFTVGEALGAVGLSGTKAMAPATTVSLAFAISRLGGCGIQPDCKGVTREFDGRGSQHRNQSEDSNQNLNRSHRTRLPDHEYERRTVHET